MHASRGAHPAPITLVHARYRQAGGEDRAVEAHAALLRSHGHAVSVHDVSNEGLAAAGLLTQASRTIWNGEAHAALGARIARDRPALVHVHNTFPGLSPSVLHAAHSAGVPVVQTLHNYRLVCPNGLLFRDGARCTECVSRTVKWPAVQHGCYRDSRAASAVTAAMLAAHAAKGTWARTVDRYIALTEAARTRFVEGGLPASRIVVQPGFLAHDPGVGTHRGGYALYVGRLSREKGVETMLRAWREAAIPGWTLRVVGSGPLEHALPRDVPGVEFLGECDNAHVLGLMRDAELLVFPSECDEGFPVTLLEAFATGLPVISGSHGAMGDVVTDGRTGLHFTAGNATDLAAALRRAFSQADLRAALGRAARARWEREWTAQHAYARLSALYDELIARAAVS